jgi:hypothetical protein
MNKSFVKLLQSFAGITLLSMASFSMAATWDYDFDDGGLEAGYQPLIDGDLTVNGYYEDTELGYAYLDHDAHGKAGLGVCDDVSDPGGTGTGNECDTTGDANGTNGSSDDSLQAGEFLEFVFDASKGIANVGINGNHAAASGDVLIWTDTGSWDLLTIAAGKITLNLYLTTLKIFGQGDFGQGKIGETTGPNLYVAGINEVPIPAAAWLFGSALLGLTGLRRRKSAA